MIDILVRSRCSAQKGKLIRDVLIETQGGSMQHATHKRKSGSLPGQQIDVSIPFAPLQCNQDARSWAGQQDETDLAYHVMSACATKIQCGAAVDSCCTRPVCSRRQRGFVTAKRPCPDPTPVLVPAYGGSLLHGCSSCTPLAAKLSRDTWFCCDPELEQRQTLAFSWEQRP